MVLLVVLMYTATIMPYKLALIDEIDEGWLIIETIVDFCFLGDIVVTLNTPIDRKNEPRETRRSKIFCNYLKGWLIIDFFASIPMGLIEKALIGDTGLSNA